jgi:hypothetical protein
VKSLAPQRASSSPSALKAPSPSPSPSAPVTLERLTVESLKPLQCLYTVVLFLLLVTVGLFLARLTRQTYKNFTKPMNIVVPGLFAVNEDTANQFVEDLTKTIEALQEEQKLSNKTLSGQREHINALLLKVKELDLNAKMAQQARENQFLAGDSHPTQPMPES